jgi:putative NADH-flavin reductase
MSISVDLNDVAQAYKEQRNALADHNAVLSASNGVLQRRLEAVQAELDALKKAMKQAPE